MARFRMRLRFNPGRNGAPVDKLGEFASQAEKFLRALSHDLGVPVKKGEWIANNFSNESVSFDSEFGGRVNPLEAAKGLQAIRIITGDNPLDACNKGIISYGTMAEFSRLGKALDPDEHFEVGIYEDDLETHPKEWKNVGFSKIAEIRQLLDAPYVSYGSAQGVMHGWIMETNAPFFNIRELSSGSLIKCFYEQMLHAKVHNATKAMRNILIVYGDMKWDRTTNSIIEIEIKDLDISRSLSEFEFDSLFGSAPQFVGSLTSSEYIEWLRGDGE